MLIDLKEVEKLKNKYKAIPNELQLMKRWVCYKQENVEGRDTKVPYNAIDGSKAKSNDKSTWTTFDLAIRGCIKYHFNGIGIMLGEGLSGIDLDNHADVKTGIVPMTEEQFNAFVNEIVDQMDTYAEWSPHHGCHILFKGTLPQGRKRNSKIIDGILKPVEMYGSLRFLTVTGNNINNKGLNERTQQAKEVWLKYVDDSEEIKQRQANSNYVPTYKTNLTDQELLDKAFKAKDGNDFKSLYYGDISAYHNDHSAADMAFCSKLAFWCNGDINQMDRIFRSSGLIREKWDVQRGTMTYGQLTLTNAIKNSINGYNPVSQSVPKNYDIYYNDSNENTVVDETTGEVLDVNANAVMNIDENNMPIFREKQNFSKYAFTDDGNAQRFYDYFGELFKYNCDSKTFLFWTGKTWIEDGTKFIDKYITKLTEIMKKELEKIDEDIEHANETDGEDSDTYVRLSKLKLEAAANIKRISNQLGHNALKNAFQSIADVPVLSSAFDNDPYLLNTESGIVNLQTGVIEPFNRNKMLSKNTHCEVSYSTPKVWLKFLNDIFYRGTSPQEMEETKQIIDIVQQILGISLTGSTREQKMFLLYGSGSNGKSTFIDQIMRCFGDYATTIGSEILMAQKNVNSSVQFTLAELMGTRLVITSETDTGEKLSEKTIKIITGGEDINAQKKFGKPFTFKPQFKPFMMTNNLPIIIGQDYGIWRRIFLIPFVRRFEDNEKDMDMPDKLKAETAQILGWCIQGYQKYVKEGSRLVMPECLKKYLTNYRDDMDIIARFLSKCCRITPNINAKESCSDVYQAYKFWAKDNSDYVFREPVFYNKLVKEKGIKTECLSNGEQVYLDIELLPSAKQRANIKENRDIYY